MSGELIPFSREAVEAIATQAGVESSPIVKAARGMPVDNAERFATAGEMRKEASRRDKVLEDEFRPIKQSIDAAKKTVLDLEKKAREPYQSAKQILDEKMLAFEAAEESRRRAAEATLQAAARKLEEEARIRSAENAIAQGIPEEAALAILDAPSTAPAVSVASTVPKVAGVAFRDLWIGEVVDLVRLVQFVAMNPTFSHLLLPNAVAINTLARAQKEALDVPGLRAVCKRTVAGART